jgi:hypothetical protein
MRERASRLEWLSARLDVSDKASTRRLAVCCAAVFLAAIGVRLLHWQDARVEMERGESLQTTLVRPYRHEALRMEKDASLVFPRNPPEPGDARMIIHPPGYSILLRMLYSDLEADDVSYVKLRLAQVVCDSLSAVLVFLIAAELFNLTLAVMAGTLAALSPHFAHYSLWLSPETLAAFPILLAVYLIVRARKRPRLVTFIAAGAMVGLSCWLRSNALLLAPLLAIVILLLFNDARRWRFAAALVGAALVVIAPITVRNWAVYHRFIPLSLGAGITLIEGIAEFDTEGRFGLPATDREAVHKDAEWYGRPEYAGNLWSPDGVERDRARFARGLSVIRAHPAWFFKVMLHRMWSMLRYNDSFGHGWAYHIASAPIVSAEAPYGHSLSNTDQQAPAWSGEPVDLLPNGETLSSEAEAGVTPEGTALIITGDASEFGDQFATAPIAVEEDTDYLLTLPVEVERGIAAVKVTTTDRRITLASKIVAEGRKGGQVANTQVAFATGNRSQVRLVLSNNGAAPPRPRVQVGRVELFKAGPTPLNWTRHPRLLFRFLQKSVFRTERMLVLIALGVALLLLARNARSLVILLAVPAYYLCTQSFLHTEYRYILAIHHFLFIIAAVTIYCVVMALKSQTSRLRFKI